MNTVEKIKAEVARRTGKTFEKFDFQNRTYKSADGEQRIRMLPNLDEEGIPYLEDHYHKINENTYIDCLDKETCLICKNLKNLWNKDSTVRQAMYREYKAIKRWQWQIVLLNNEGEIANEIPKLWSVPKTLQKLILEKVISMDMDPTESDFVIVRKGEGKDTDYSDSHFTMPEVDIPDSILATRVKLDANRWYFNEKWILPLKEAFGQVGVTFIEPEDKEKDR
jgi:hypothetical protein